ncbi:hypothetical protein [Desulfurococcus mucosus]|uniref:ABC3 transporter permease protein domain-containing protein n=1 Tax=Desulfurococcus mucosus (strain ATCC 35584 / DSM 2162 / JCM 9187 / O7/1) TaxID=765177 RepID=E8R8G2_DESM0|nr:hypothetical protein [Desulfurococcus mucosus]ADV64788.1 hypothetical protein Desmu_0475 [Desulfurococcus mucosus DSM 2162]
MTPGIYVRVYAATLVLALPVAAAIALMLSVTQGVLGFYGGLTRLGSGEVAVTGYSLSPFTALVNVTMAEEALGVKASRYELFTLAEYNGVFLIVRGTPGSGGGGSGPGLPGGCENCCIVGSEASGILGVRAGDVVLLTSPFNGRRVPVYIEGVADSEPYRYELACSMGTVLLLRGAPPGYASVVYFNASSVNASRLPGLSVPGNLAGALIVVLSHAGPAARAAAYRSVSDAYLSTLGFSSVVVSAVDIAVSTIVASSLYAVGVYAPRLIAGEVRVLRLIGVSARRIKLSVLAVEALAASSSWLLAYLLAGRVDPGVRLLLHPVHGGVDPAAYAASLAAGIVILTVAVAGWRVE